MGWVVKPLPSKAGKRGITMKTLNFSPFLKQNKRNYHIKSKLRIFLASSKFCESHDYLLVCCSYALNQCLSHMVSHIRWQGSDKKLILYETRLKNNELIQPMHHGINALANSLVHVVYYNNCTKKNDECL